MSAHQKASLKLRIVSVTRARIPKNSYPEYGRNFYHSVRKIQTA
jgi:hypothetical protein